MEESMWSVAVLATVVALALVALMLVARMLRDIRDGVPLKDERTRSLNARAGSYAFFLSGYSTLALGFVFVLLEDRGITLPNSELLFIVVAMMGTIHIAFRTYLDRSGRGSSA